MIEEHDTWGASERSFLVTTEEKRNVDGIGNHNRLHAGCAPSYTLEFFASLDEYVCNDNFRVFYTRTRAYNAMETHMHTYIYISITLTKS